MKCSKKLTKRIAMTLTVLMTASSLGAIPAYADDESPYVGMSQEEIEAMLSNKIAEAMASAEASGADVDLTVGEQSGMGMTNVPEELELAMRAIDDMLEKYGDIVDLSISESPFGGNIIQIVFKSGISQSQEEQEVIAEEIKQYVSANSDISGHSIKYAVPPVDTSKDTEEDTRLKAYGKQKIQELMNRFPMLVTFAGEMTDSDMDYTVDQFYNQLTENRTKTITEADIDTYVDAVSAQLSAMLSDTSAGGLSGLATGLLGAAGDSTSDNDDVPDLSEDEDELTDAQIEAICDSVRRTLNGLDVNTTTPSYIDFTANPILADMALDDYLERVAAGEYSMSDVSANDYVMAVAENVEALNDIMRLHQESIADWWLDDSGNIELYFDIEFTTDEQNAVYAELESKMATLPLKNWIVKLPSKTFTNYSTEAQREAADRDTKFSAFSSHTSSDYLLAFVTGQTSDEDASNMANELAIVIADLAKGDKNAFGKGGYLEIEVMQSDHTSRIYSFDFDDLSDEDDVAAPDISVETSTGGADDDDEVATVMLDENGNYVTVTTKPASSTSTDSDGSNWATVDESGTKPADSTQPTDTAPATNTTPTTNTVTLSAEDIANMSADELEKYIASAVDAQVAAATKDNTVAANTTEKWTDSPKTVETQATGFFWLIGILGTIGLGAFGTVYMINKRR